MKFDQLLVAARQIGADRVATGHYAQVTFNQETGRWLLKRPADKSKDQTYFLFGLTQEQLSRTMFPLGGMTKPEVRELARKHALVIAEKPDSQEICFVPGGDYKRFLDAYLAEQGEPPLETPGEMVTTDGRVIGEHSGIHNFTVGQRKGLGVATGWSREFSARLPKPASTARTRRARQTRRISTSTISKAKRWSSRST